MSVITKTDNGYTIIEVMIFLAVSGMMFVMAAVFINGKQANGEFKQGMSDANAQIQSAINDVSNGNYPSSGNFTCRANPTGPTFSPGSVEQGANQGCIFLGKVIQFGYKGTNNTGYAIYTVAGNQFADGTADGSSDNGQLSTDLSQVKPVAVISPVDLTDLKTLGWGLTATHMYSYASSDVNHTGSYQKVGAIGFFGSFGQYTGSILGSGSQTVNTVILPGSYGPDAPSANQKTESNMQGAIKAISDPDIVASPNVVICFQGGRNQHGSIIIGTSGQRLTTDIEMGNGVPGVCLS